jgi:hypothetical protein
MFAKLREFTPLGSRVFYPHAHEQAKGAKPGALFLFHSWACGLQTRVPSPYLDLPRPGGHFVSQ